MRRLVVAALVLILFSVAPRATWADMYQDAGNAKLPEARINLGVGTYDPVKDHNAPTDGTSDAVAQINASLQDCQAAGGGRVILPPRQYAIIGADLTVPAGCSLEMSSSPRMQQFNGTRPTGPGARGVDIDQPAIRLDAARTINNHGTVRSLAIFKRGLAYPTSLQNTFTQVSAFSGTAITNSTDDTVIDDVFIIGFDTCVRTDNFQRPYMRRLRLHCKNGLYFNDIHDVGHIGDVHGWGYFPGNDPNGYAGEYLDVTGVANNGSGQIRLTLDSTSTLMTGNPVGVRLVGGFAGANGDWTATVVDGTHIDLQGSVYAGPSTTGTWALGETFVATASLNGVWPGQAITGTGIPPGTTVRTIDPHKPGLWLSQPVTGAGTGAALSFANGAYTSGGRVLLDAVTGPMETFISVTNSEEMHFTDVFQHGWKVGAYLGNNAMWSNFVSFGCDSVLEHMPARVCMVWDGTARLNSWVGGQGGGNGVLLVDKTAGGVNSINGVDIREPFGAPFVVASLQGAAESQLVNMFSSCGTGCAAEAGSIAIYTGAGRKSIGGTMPWVDLYPQNYNVAMTNTLTAPGTALAAGSPFDNVRISWLPELRVGGASVGVTYAAQQGFARRAWPYIEADFSIALTAKGSGAGGVEVGGLPHACGSVISGGAVSTAVVWPAVGLTGAPVFEQINDSSIIRVMQNNATGLAAVTDANITNASTVRGQFRCLMQWVQR